MGWISSGFSVVGDRLTVGSADISLQFRASDGILIVQKRDGSSQQNMAAMSADFYGGIHGQSGLTGFVLGDWQIGGHYIANATGVPASSALGANVTSVTPSGNDTRGELTIVMAGALAANTRIATITFAATYGATAPKVILVDQTSAVGIGLVNFYVLAQSTGVSFDIASDQALGAGTYKVDYIAIG